jgi:hypothetical protein
VDWLDAVLTGGGTILGGGMLAVVWRRVARWVRRQDWVISARPRPTEEELRARVAALEARAERAESQAAACRAHADQYRDERDNARSLLEAALAQGQRHERQ